MKIKVQWSALLFGLLVASWASLRVFEFFDAGERFAGRATGLWAGLAVFLGCFLLLTYPVWRDLLAVLRRSFFAVQPAERKLSPPKPRTT